MGIRWQITFAKIEFYAICESYTRNVKILGRTLYSPSLEDVGKLTERLLAKLHPPNLVNTMFDLVF